MVCLISRQVIFLYKKISIILLFVIVQLLILNDSRVFGQNDLKTENIFLITLDGLRWQELFTGAESVLIRHEDYVRNQDYLYEKFWDEDPAVRREKLMPFFWNVIGQKGQLYGNRKWENNVNLTNTFMFSYPGYNELLTGFADKNIDSNSKVWNPNKTVLEFVDDHESFRGKVAAFGSWDVFPYIINSQRSGIPVNAGFEPVKGDNLTLREEFLNELLHQIPSPWDNVRLDAFTHHFAMEHIMKYEPRLIYIAYGETDDFAHNGNYEDYLKSAEKTDDFIRQIWEYVQSHPIYKDTTTLIITTDHGRGTDPVDHWRSHGTNIPGSDQIWIAVMGPDTPPSGEIKTPGQLYLNQIAGTLSVLLGLHYVNEQPVGDIIRNFFTE